MSADVTKFVCSSAQNWAIRCGGCQVYVLVAKCVLNVKLAICEFILFCKIVQI